MLHYAAATPKDLGDLSNAETECLQENGETVGEEKPYTGLGKAISDAVDDGADIISISLGGAVEATDEVAKAHAAGVIVVAAMPNEGNTVNFPAAYNGVVAVQAFDVNGNIQTSTPSIDLAESTPNVSDGVTVAAPGIDLLVQGTATSWADQRLASGTSLATPIVAGFLAVVKQKYPEATAGQLIDSLIRNTGGDPDHEPTWGNDMGYGAVSLAAAHLKTSSRSTPTATAADLDDKSPVSAPWLVGGGIVGILLLMGGFVLAVVLTRSSRRRGAERGSSDGRQSPARRSQHDGGPDRIGLEDTRR